MAERLLSDHQEFLRLERRIARLEEKCGAEGVHGIGWAIKQMVESGCLSVRRNSWPGGYRIYIPGVVAGFGEVIMEASPDKLTRPWFPTHADLLAIDWQIV